MDNQSQILKDICSLNTAVSNLVHTAQKQAELLDRSDHTPIKDKYHWNAFVQFKTAVAEACGLNVGTEEELENFEVSDLEVILEEKNDDLEETHSQLELQKAENAKLREENKELKEKDKEWAELMKDAMSSGLTGKIEKLKEENEDTLASLNFYQEANKELKEEIKELKDIINKMGDASVKDHPYCVKLREQKDKAMKLMSESDIENNDLKKEIDCRKKDYDELKEFAVGVHNKIFGTEFNDPDIVDAFDYDEILAKMTDPPFPVLPHPKGSTFACSPR